MKKVLYTDFEGVDDVIAKMMSDKAFKKAITRTNLYNFWAKVVGTKFAKNSKPYSMTTNHVMVIACQNAMVAQELLLRKTKILKDFEPYLKSLDIKVKDLRFDAKKWVNEEEE